MNYIIYFLSGLAIFFSLFYVYAKYKLSYWSRRGVKSPPTHLIFGNFKDTFFFKKQPGEVLRDIYDYADPDDAYIGFYIFHEPVLLLRNYDIIKHVMIKNFDIFNNRRFGSIDGKDVMNLENLLATKFKWKYLRNKMSPALATHRLKNAIPLMQVNGKYMLDYFEKLSTNETGWKMSTEIYETSSRYVNDILSSFVLGIDANSFHENSKSLWQTVTNIFGGFKGGLIFFIYFFIPPLIPLVKLYTAKNVKYFRKRFNDSMTIREKTGNERGDVLDFLLTLKNGEQNYDFKFEGDNLLAQALSFYIAGLDATSIAIQFAISQLARCPEYQTNLYDEIQTHLSEKEITMERIEQMCFLDSFVNEILRLYPPLPFTDRIAQQNFKLPSGLIIEKNISVFVSTSGINKDSKYFPNPLDFNPLRTKDIEHNNFYESLAFGVRPRSCIGQKLALLMIKVAVIMVISNYNLFQEKKRQDIYPFHAFVHVTGTQQILFKKRDKSV